MTSSKALHSNMQKHLAEIWVTDAKPFSAEKRERLASRYLSDEEQKRLAKTTHPQTADVFLCARAMTRKVLAQKTAQKPDEINIALAENGKPYLPDFPELHFNISHAQRKIALAVAPVPTGIDLENSARNIEKSLIIKKYFTEAERKSIDDSGDTTEAFFSTWTAKEAILKGTGEGLGGLNSLELSLTPTEHTGNETYGCKFASTVINSPNYAAWTSRTFMPSDTHIATVALKAPDFLFELNLFNTDSL